MNYYFKEMDMEPENGIRFSDYDMLIIAGEDEEVLVSFEEGSDKIIIKNGLTVHLRPKDPSKEIEEYK